MSNPQLTPATIQIQYNYYSKSSFSSTIGISNTTGVTSGTGTGYHSHQWNRNWLSFSLVEQELVIILTSGTGTAQLTVSHKHVRIQE
jgi:spore coat protein U-like protein